MEDDKKREEGAEGSERNERDDARRMRDRRRYRLDEPFDVGAPAAKPDLEAPRVRFPVLLLALQRQEEMRDAAQRTAATAAVVAPAESEREDPPLGDEWRRLWDDMQREAHAPKRGWEPEAAAADPASPEANPEIADWERHWPSQANGHCGDGACSNANEEQGAADRSFRSMPAWLPSWLAWIWRTAARKRGR